MVKFYAVDNDAHMDLQKMIMQEMFNLSIQIKSEILSESSPPLIGLPGK